MSAEPQNTAPTTEYLTEPTGWVRSQLDTIDATGTTTSVDVMGRPVMVVIVRGKRSGKLRRVPLMRVEHEGRYLAVASKGGAPKHPVWYHSIVTNPDVRVLDGTEEHTDLRARLLTDGPERDEWWQRAVAVFPPYAEYQERTERQIPLLVLEPAAG